RRCSSCSSEPWPAPWPRRRGRTRTARPRRSSRWPRSGSAARRREASAAHRRARLGVSARVCRRRCCLPPPTGRTRGSGTAAPRPAPPGRLSRRRPRTPPSGSRTGPARAPARGTAPARTAPGLPAPASPLSPLP
ncbi:Os03g0730301, partial [Oryza sativa Japonica Group]